MTSSSVHFSSVQFISISMKRSCIITTNYRSAKSMFAHGGNSKKTERSSKSGATALIKFESNHNQTVTSNVYLLNI